MAEFSRNPEHRRSHLVRLTARGKELLEEMWEREMALLNSLKLDISLDDLQAAANVLRHLRATFEQFPFPSEEERI